MNWRTDKPTANIIVVFLKGSCYPQVLEYDKDRQCYLEEHNSPVNIQDIEKWADFEEDETVTDCDELEEEIDRAIDDLEGVAEKDADGVLIAHLTLIEHLKDFARHFAKWGAEHRDRFLNWIRDLIKKGIEKPEEALNILKRIDALINDDSLWGKHLKKIEK